VLDVFDGRVDDTGLMIRQRRPLPNEVLHTSRGHLRRRGCRPMQLGIHGLPCYVQQSRGSLAFTRHDGGGCANKSIFRAPGMTRRLSCATRASD